MNGVLQSGLVTPGHLASWTTDGVIQDAGVSFFSTLFFCRYDVTNINFNAANTDTPLFITLPAGFTRWKFGNIYIYNASASLTSATIGAFTLPGAGGSTIVTGGTAVTVSSSVNNTNNNFQNLVAVTANTELYDLTTIYFRVQNAAGAPATANVTLSYIPYL